MAGYHQVLVGFDHTARDPVGRFVELEPQPGASPTDRRTHRRRILADPGGEHDPVKASKSCGKRGDMAGNAATKYFDGKACTRIVTGQELAKIRRNAGQPEHTGPPIQ